MGGSNASQQRGWSEHPVYVAGLSVVGTIAICITLYKEVLLPAQMATSEFKIAELNRQLQNSESENLKIKLAATKSKESDMSEIKRLSDELAVVKKTLEQVSLEFEGFKVGSLFFEGGVYPSAFDRVKVGQSVELVDKVFEGSSIEKEDAYVTVKVNHPFFDHITFYHSEEAPHLIYQIMYSAPYGVERKVGVGYLQSQLESAFGKALKIAEKHYLWKANDKVNVFKHDDQSFIVSDNTSVPGGWDRVIYKFYESTAKKEMSE